MLRPSFPTHCRTSPTADRCLAGLQEPWGLARLAPPLSSLWATPPWENGLQKEGRHRGNARRTVMLRSTEGTADTRGSSGPPAKHSKFNAASTVPAEPSYAARIWKPSVEPLRRAAPLTPPKAAASSSSAGRWWDSRTWNYRTSSWGDWEYGGSSSSTWWQSSRR